VDADVNPSSDTTQSRKATNVVLACRGLKELTADVPTESSSSSDDHEVPSLDTEWSSNSRFRRFADELKAHLPHLVRLNGVSVEEPPATASSLAGPVEKKPPPRGQTSRPRSAAKSAPAKKGKPTLKQVVSSRATADDRSSNSEMDESEESESEGGTKQPSPTEAMRLFRNREEAEAAMAAFVKAKLKVLYEMYSKDRGAPME
jgi:hypothetical protein